MNTDSNSIYVPSGLAITLGATRRTETTGGIDRTGSRMDYGLVYAVYLLLVLGIAAVATYFGQNGFPPDPSTYAIG
jgi:hypothetical protein